MDARSRRCFASARRRPKPRGPRPALAVAEREAETTGHAALRVDDDLVRAGVERRELEHGPIREPGLPVEMDRRLLDRSPALTCDVDAEGARRRAQHPRA